VVGVLVLLALLLQKELASAAQAHRYHSLSQALNLGIAPMQISRVGEALRHYRRSLGGHSGACPCRDTILSQCRLVGRYRPVASPR